MYELLICLEHYRKNYMFNLPFFTFYTSISAKLPLEFSFFTSDTPFALFFTLSTYFMNLSEWMKGVPIIFNSSMYEWGFMLDIDYTCYIFIMYATLPFISLISSSMYDKLSWKFVPANI